MTATIETCSKCGQTPCVHPDLCNRPPYVPHVYKAGDKVKASPSWLRNPEDKLSEACYADATPLGKAFMDGVVCEVVTFNAGKNSHGTVVISHPDHEGTKELWEPWCRPA